jgi:hypothetical protein
MIFVKIFTLRCRQADIVATVSLPVSMTPAMSTTLVLIQNVDLLIDLLCIVGKNTNCALISIRN